MRRCLLIAALLTACDVPEQTRVREEETASQPADTAPIAPTIDTELRLALEELLRGPAPGDSTREHTWFSAKTANALRSVQVDSAGNATVDFDDLRALIPNASSSAGSRILLEDLNAVVFSFPAIQSVEYRINGSCDVFWDWLQYGCQRVTREWRP